ncbi:dicarboxylate/amino acid:cation symporter [Methylobacterium haplocladii]|uniref:C4-dicarboxylate ABC transporter n=1 Tax=Methylobacterium haplocladii TaxID=1176176 RepID=A0A512IJB6_9HYPH|nr:dicarboxylate/amino acid:cation symporter [Methylobacterium haplocladii]GEO97795.1 C4-dicarboxylate ABC transporter [Methylobacterium haplocladii]GJD82641.1 Proton/sodium-glutamate symport protein [Methylobacterium haplocladii]GLS57572.1 membrane attached sodium:dicarboxylate symporter family protein [Methylobacterium haplocladii]
MSGNRLTTMIFIGMVLGILVGYLCSITWPDPQTAKEISGYIALISDVFLRLIKMIIAPLVFSTLVVGIAHMGDTASVGRVGGKALLWFVGASFCSLMLGLILVNLLQPGHNLNLPLPDVGAGTGLKAASLSLKEFVTHLVPKSAVEAMANNEILQIVVFSIFFGVGLAAIGEKGHALAQGIEQLAEVMLKVTGYVMMFAPVAVFAAIAATITTQGIGVLATYGKFLVEFYLSLGVLWCALALAGFLLLGGPSLMRLLNLIKEPFVLAFSTASSEAAYPKTLSNLEKFGVPNRITSFVLPMGYSFNLDGSMMYCTFAVMFIAQAYNIPLTWGQQLTMLFLLMVTSKGMAGVPRASLVVISATLSQFNIPEAGLLLIIGIDQFLDMGRSATNVLGNSIATVAVAKWEGQLSTTEQGLEGAAPLPSPAE